MGLCVSSEMRQTLRIGNEMRCTWSGAYNGHYKIGTHAGVVQTSEVPLTRKKMLHRVNNSS